MQNKNERRQNNPLLFGRRVRFAFIILISQILLIALAITFLIQLLFIANNGAITFVERKSIVLFGEIGLVAIIIIFGICVFYFQVKRLGEKRKLDTSEETGTRSTDIQK